MPLRGADVAESKKQIHCRLARKATAEGAVAIYVSWCARSKNERCHRDPSGVYWYLAKNRLASAQTE